jgi:HK97 family phage portal protein
MKILNSLRKLMPKMGNPNNPNLWPAGGTLARSLSQYFANKTSSNITVTPENAFTVSAYYCAVRAISEDVAKLPVRMYTLDDSMKKKPIQNNALKRVLTKGFNDEVDSMHGIQMLMQWLLTYQNAYCEIARNSAGYMQWYLIHPSRVQVHRDNNTRKLYYTVESTTELDRQSSKSRTLRMEENEILHLKGAIGNGIVGYNLAEVAGASLGISMAAQNFTSAFFGNNLSIGATLETPRALDADVKQAIRKEWSKEFGGSGNAGGIAILDRDFKFNRIQMASTDAEMLKTREFQISEIARWFRIPPHKIMEMKGAKFNNVEQQNIEYVTDCLGPWISRLETQLKFKFHRNDNTVVDIDEKALLRGDQAARTQYYKELYMMSAITPQEIAKIEGLPYEEAPDKYYQQLNIQSVELTEESQNLDKRARTTRGRRDRTTGKRDSS